jgi:ribosomal protein L21E
MYRLLILRGADNEQSYLFIQQSKLDELKTKSSGESFTITVDDSFQYGQKNKQGDGRWLVYHDKSRNPFQVRVYSDKMSAFAAY